MDRDRSETSTEVFNLFIVWIVFVFVNQYDDKGVLLSLNTTLDVMTFRVQLGNVTFEDLTLKINEVWNIIFFHNKKNCNFSLFRNNVKFVMVHFQLQFIAKIGSINLNQFLIAQQWWHLFFKTSSNILLFTSSYKFKTYLIIKLIVNIMT